MEPLNQHSNIGIVWYTKIEWEKMKEISSDSERLENSFEEWGKISEKALRDMKANGLIVEKVFIKTNEFSIWCKIHSMPVDAASRSRYVSEILSKRNNN